MAASYVQFDSPPRPVLEQWLPELLNDYDAVQAAQKAAQDARTAFIASWETTDKTRQAGADWKTAQAKDDHLIDQGKPARHCAALIAERPVREQQAAALQRRYARLASDWNLAAHLRVADDSWAAIQAAELDARSDCLATAKKAVDAADNGRPADRLTNSLSLVAELQQYVKRWRELRTLVGWVAWKRPIPNGRAWDPARMSRQVPLDDASVTEAGDRSIGVVEEALSLADDRLRQQLTYRRKADGKDLVRP